jgi:hypothetical protein
MGRREGSRSSAGGWVAIALFSGLVACGGRPVEDAPALATATAIPVGAPGATGVTIPTSPVGAAKVAGPTPEGDGDGELPKDMPPTPFAPEHPKAVPQPSATPHSGVPKKPPPPKGITL